MIKFNDDLKQVRNIDEINKCSNGILAIFYPISFSFQSKSNRGHWLILYSNGPSKLALIGTSIISIVGKRVSTVGSIGIWLPVNWVIMGKYL
jgi:hypothetical protein